MAAVYWIIILCCILVGSVTCHPQCLDGKPPFSPSRPLSFCTEYGDSVGCCTNTQDTAIRNRYSSLIGTISSSTCGDYMKQILCQECSPYAAHLFNYETTGVVSPLPGMCLSYCTRVHQSCGVEDLAKLSTNRRYRAFLNSISSFCNYVRAPDLDYCYPNLKTNPVLTESFIRQRDTDSPGCMCLQKVAENHNLVTFIETHPTNDSLMYVGEQRGVVYLYIDGRKRSRPFLDLSQQVLLSRSHGDERGLLGLVFHPNFSSNKRFFLYYVLSGSSGQTVRISSWTARSHLTARRRSERTLLDIPQPFFNHNGGQLLFGDDGYLYIFTGDGGGAGDPHNNGQNITSYMGKALRINVSVGRRGSYTSPNDNPFVGRAGLDEIYAYGLRNPWRCSVDRGDPRTGSGKGRIFCSDVGQNRFEEIDIISKGGNYGWATREGNQCYGFSRDCGKINSEVMPIFAYPHSFGKSITGGYVYRGCDYPEFNGDYFYGDYTSGRMARLSETFNRWTSTEIEMCSAATCTGNWVSSYAKGITTFGTNHQSDIFMSSSDGSSATIYKLIMQPYRRSDPDACRRTPVSSLIVLPEPRIVVRTYNRTTTRKPWYYNRKKETTTSVKIDVQMKTSTAIPTAVEEMNEENALETYNSRRLRHLSGLLRMKTTTTPAPRYIRQSMRPTGTTRKPWYERTTPSSTQDYWKQRTKNPAVTYSWQKWLKPTTTPTPTKPILSDRKYSYRTSTYQWQRATTPTPSTPDWRRRAITLKPTTRNWRQETAQSWNRAVLVTTSKPSVTYSWQSMRAPNLAVAVKPSVYKHSHATTPSSRPTTYSWRESKRETLRPTYSWQRTTTSKPFSQQRQIYTPRPRLTTHKPYSWERNSRAYHRIINARPLGRLSTEFPLPEYLQSSEDTERYLTNDRYDPYKDRHKSYSIGFNTDRYIWA